MLVGVKVFILQFARQLENVFHVSAVRYIVKNFFGTGELSMLQWFSLDFWRSLTLKQFLGLGLIASFTLVTFPLGIWLSSFNAGVSYPLGQIAAYGIALFTVPLNLWTLSQTVKEIDFNRTTLAGLVIVEVAMGLSAVGWWLIYRGNS